MIILQFSILSISRIYYVQQENPTPVEYIRSHCIGSECQCRPRESRASTAWGNQPAENKQSIVRSPAQHRHSTVDIHDFCYNAAAASSGSLASGLCVFQPYSPPLFCPVDFAPGDAARCRPRCSCSERNLPLHEPSGHLGGVLSRSLGSLPGLVGNQPESLPGRPVLESAAGCL